MVNWGVGTSSGPYTVYGDCSHKLVAEPLNNYLFRSKAGKPDIVDWVNDFLILPTKPIAVKSFKGRLYAWDSSNTYVINEEGFFIEDVYEGIGILNKEAVVVTDFGMCFADLNNIYLHDGVRANPIGTPILRNHLHRKWRVGYINSVEVALAQNHDIIVFYDAKHHSFVVTTKGFCKEICIPGIEVKTGARGFAYNILRQRWDFWEIEDIHASATGYKGNVYLSDGFNLFKHKGLRNDTRPWEWQSKNLSLEADTLRKVFKKLKVTGKPSSVENANVVAYVDEVAKTLTIDNSNYTTVASGETLSFAGTGTTTATYTYTDDDTTFAGAIRQGQHIKLGDEIMKVSAEAISGTTMTLTVVRSQMGTTPTTHTDADVFIVGPTYSFPASTQGYKARIKLANQYGTVDSIGLIYRPKGIK